MFDWDGTLMDSTQSVVKTIKTTGREFELTEPDDESIQVVLGLPLVVMAEKLFGAIDLDRFANSYYQNFHAFSQEAVLFEDAESTLQQLKAKGYLLAIATNKKRFELIKALEKLNISDLFCTLRCGDDGFPKPDPEMLLDLLDEVKVATHQALMVGDTESDLLAARDAGVDSIAVARGIRDEKLLETYQPVKIIHQLYELMNYLSH